MKNNPLSYFLLLTGSHTIKINIYIPFTVVDRVGLGGGGGGGGAEGLGDDIRDLKNVWNIFVFLQDMGACSSRCAADINNRLTDHKTHDCTKKGKQPERLDEG